MDKYEQLMQADEKYWSGKCLLCGLNRIECERKMDNHEPVKGHEQLMNVAAFLALMTALRGN